MALSHALILILIQIIMSLEMKFIKIHHSNIGEFPEIPNEHKKLINKGLIKTLKLQNGVNFWKQLIHFLMILMIWNILVPCIQ